MERVKVLCVINRFHPVFTGQGVFLRRLMRQLNKKGIEANILTNSFGGKYPSIEQIDNFKVYRVEAPLKKSIKYLRGFVNIFAWMKKHRELFDIIHLNGWESIFLSSSLLAKKLWNKSIILEMSLMGSDDAVSVLEGKKGIIVKQMMTHIDHYIPLSEPIKSSSLKAGIPADRITKIPQMVDTEKYKPIDSQNKLVIRESLGLPKNSFIISFIGAIIPRKGVDILITAFEKTVKALAKKDLFLLLIGPKHLTHEDSYDNSTFVEYIDKTIAESEYIKDKFLFVGRVDNVDEYLKASDLFVFPSKREGLPSAILEAGASGLAGIVSPLDGVCKHDIFIDEDEGLIVELNSHSFANAMIDLITNDGKRKLLGRNARKRMCESFSPDIITDKYIKLYKHIRNGKTKNFTLNRLAKLNAN